MAQGRSAAFGETAKRDHSAVTRAGTRAVVTYRAAEIATAATSHHLASLCRRRS
jgi:hypothetical protein